MSADLLRFFAKSSVSFSFRKYDLKSGADIQFETFKLQI